MKSGLIPFELLPTGRRLHRSGSPHTCPCQLWPSHSPGQLLMPDIHSRRFRIRYTCLCQRLLPNWSLHRIHFGEKKKRVSIQTRPLTAVMIKVSDFDPWIIHGEDIRTSTLLLNFPASSYFPPEGLTKTTGHPGLLFRISDQKKCS